VITVTVRFDDTATREPAGLTMVMLKPELFRIAIDAGDAQDPVPILVTGQFVRFQGPRHFS